MRGSNERATRFSRRLRRNATDAERRIWSGLRNRQLGGFKFVRQEPVGVYTVDFCCRDERLVVELDGGQHADSDHDRRRDAWLRQEGYRVLRFWNNDALANTDGVVEAILAQLAAHAPPHPGPISAGGGEGAPSCDA